MFFSLPNLLKNAIFTTRNKQKKTQMRFFSVVIVFSLFFLFSCKSSKDTTVKNEQATTSDKKETPYEIKQNEKVPSQSIGSPTPSGGTNGARPEPQ